MGTHRQDKRWLPTNHKHWIAIRDHVKAEEPLCRVCGELTTDIDHINGRADREEDYERSNLQGLCKMHHSEKTAQMQAGKPWKPKGCDVNGEPFRVPSGPWNVSRRGERPNVGAGQPGKLNGGRRSLSLGG